MKREKEMRGITLLSYAISEAKEVVWNREGRRNNNQ